MAFLRAGETEALFTAAAIENCAEPSPKRSACALCARLTALRTRARHRLHKNCTVRAPAAKHGTQA